MHTRTLYLAVWCKVRTPLEEYVVVFLDLSRLPITCHSAFHVQLASFFLLSCALVAPRENDAGGRC